MLHTAPGYIWYAVPLLNASLSAEQRPAPTITTVRFPLRNQPNNIGSQCDPCGAPFMHVADANRCSAM